MSDGGTQFALNVGEVPPDFALDNQFGEKVTLSALSEAVVVVFYPFAFSAICSGELRALRDNFTDLATAAMGPGSDPARLLAVSTDSKYALRAYAQAEGFDFDLLSDFWPHGDVARSFGVFDDKHGMAGRATFAIDADGILRDSFSTSPGEARNLARYRQALAQLKGAA